MNWPTALLLGAGLGSNLYRRGQDVERTAVQACAFVAAYLNFQASSAPTA